MNTKLMAGRVAAGALVALALSYAAWAQPPEPAASRSPATPPRAVWTPSANAPAGALTHKLEGQRHDRAIDLAQKGNIDVVFFGTTDTEMWSWPDRGRGVWDRTFASIKAANFGSQGTAPKTLLWRMQNGELAGYQAKLVVLYTAFCFPNHELATVAPNCAPIIAEVRARQPQAKVLLFAPFPRGQQDRDAWRQTAKAEAAAFAPLADDKAVFYADIGERFYLPDGSHNQELWHFSPLSGAGSVGAQAGTFEVWAEELQPWLDRFVR